MCLYLLGVVGSLAISFGLGGDSYLWSPPPCRYGDSVGGDLFRVCELLDGGAMRVASLPSW